MVVFQAPYVYVFDKKDWQTVRKMLMGLGTKYSQNQALLLCKREGKIGFLAQDIIKNDLTWDRKFHRHSELI
jgi:hypothetical protein